MVRLKPVASISAFELRRESNKRTLWLVIALMALPLIVAFIVRSYASSSVSDPMLWATIMGFRVGDSLGALGVSTLSVISWGWLIAILFGGDLLAADLVDGSVALVLARPVSRLEYVLGKALAAFVVMLAVFITGGVSVYGAAWVIGGPQSGFLEVLLLSMLIAVGSLPLLLLSAWFGMKFRKPVTGYVLGFVAYFVSSISVGMLAAYYIAVRHSEELAFKAVNLARAYLPIYDLGFLSRAVYGLLHPEQAGTVYIGGVEVQLAPTSYLPHAVAGLVIWITAMILLLWKTLRRMDV